MATNRYGQIYHGDYHHINIRFPSTEARLKFQNEFEAYHASHDHEGDIPIFKNVASKDLKLSTGSRSPQDLVKAESDESYRITIDGYSWNEIHDYHNPTGWNNYFWYHVPTCCVPPIIVIDHKFVDAGTLQRHELSAIFGDMPEQDYKSLLESVQRDGFIDDAIKLLNGQILDGWHRYRAAEELNLLRKLRFQVWDTQEHEDGDPKAFVLARNIERRHLNPSQRAQIVVSFNERFNRGNIDAQRNDSDSPNGEPKTRQELAQDAGVGARTIDRAVQVEKAGQSEAVIAGEKTAGEVLKEQKQARLTEARINANKALDKMWEIFHQSELGNRISPDDFMKAACEHHTNWGVDDIPEQEDTDIPEIWEARFNLLTTQIQTRSIWITEFIRETPTEEGTDPDSELLRAQERAITRRQRMWSYFASEIQIKYGKTIQEVSEEDFAKAAAVALGLDTIRVDKVGLEGVEYCFGADEFILGDIENPPYSLSDCSLADAAMWASRFDLIAIALMNMADWVKTLLEEQKAKAFDNFCNTIENLDQAWKDANLPISFEDDFLPAAADRTNFYPDTIKELYEAGKARQQHEEYEDYISWNKTFTIILRGLQERSHWVEALAVEAESEASDRGPRNTEEVPAEDEPDMNALWDAFNKRYPKWKAKYAESGYKENDLIQASTEAEMLDALRVYRETESERKGKQPTGSLPYSPSDRKGMPTADEVKDMTDLMSQQSYPFARCLRDLLRAKGISDWTQQYQQTLESVQKFKEKLKAFGAPDDLVDDSLHFYQGIEETELSTRPQETLKQLNEFLQGFIEKPLPEWPEWIRHQVPEGDAEGFPGIDIHAMRNTLSSLLQSLGIDDMHCGNLQESLGGDLLDVFLQYEELPTAKEQLIALLNTADAILSEMIP